MYYICKKISGGEEMTVISPEIIPNEPDAVYTAVGKRNLKRVTLVAAPCININKLCEVLFFMQYLCCS